MISFFESRLYKVARGMLTRKSNRFSVDEDSPSIREVKTPLTSSQLRPLDSRCRVVQFSSPLKDFEHQKLAKLLENYPNITLRVYGHNTEEGLKDLSFLKYYPFIKNFQVDVYPLSSLDGVEYLPDDLVFFGAGLTRKRLSIIPLRRFTKLKELYIEGNKKDFEVISTFIELERLDMRSITLPDLSLLVPLRNLWWLTIKLGGTKDLTLLPEIGNLKYLELWMIRGLSSIKSISGIKTIEHLFLENLKNVKELPDFSGCEKLKRIDLQKMKGLQSIKPLMSAPALEELTISEAKWIDMMEVKELATHPTLKKGGIGTGSMKKNSEIQRILRLDGIDFFDKPSN